MQSGIRVKVIWFDLYGNYLFSCSNGPFSGEASIYAEHDQVLRLADALTGFPSNNTDKRDFELGTFDPKCAGGGVRMHFYCLDSVGHASADVELQSGTWGALNEIQTVTLRIPVEAAAIDSFVSQIRLMKRETGAIALLEMAK